MFDREKIERLKSQYPEGTRIELIHMEGESLTGRGTVRFVDDIGQVHVAWDSGSTLALDPEHDVFKVI